MAPKDLTAIGLEILQTARNELYLNLPYLDVALCSLDFQPGGGVTLSLATDGETLYYDGSFLSDRYLRSRTAVDRAYLHVLLHCMLRHLWKKRGRAPELWDLACDAAVESILDELDYPCLAGGFVPAKQKFYGECRAEMPVLTAEELQQMQVEQSEELCYYVLCVVRQPVGASTVNLRCPVAVNEDTHQAMQTILETDCYGMRHRLDELSDGGCS